jgi:hypothetical protein
VKKSERQMAPSLEAERTVWLEFCGKMEVEVMGWVCPQRLRTGVGDKGNGYGDEGRSGQDG